MNTSLDCSKANDERDVTKESNMDVSAADTTILSGASQGQDHTADLQNASKDVSFNVTGLCCNK